MVGMLDDHFKRFWLSKFKPPVSRAYAGIHLCPSMYSYGAKENGTNMMPMLTFVLWEIWVFILDLGIWCFLLVSMNFQQANLLACEQDNVSDPSQQRHSRVGVIPKYTLPSYHKKSCFSSSLEAILSNLKQKRLWNKNRWRENPSLLSVNVQ